VHVEIGFREAFVYVEREMGAGGLPVGMGGHVVSLLSGGFDSPVAAYRVMKRGSRVTFVHFHSYPFLNAASMEKARDLTQLLTRYQYHSTLYLVPFGEVQRQVVLGAPEPPRVIIYRRLMVRIARAIARQVGARALVTGESLGQVASQTLDNIAVIDQAAHLLVLRPLVGWDKREILEEARRIGTYPICAIPDQDCCTLFVPRRPSTHSTEETVAEAERPLDVDRLVAGALARTQVERFTWPPAADAIPRSEAESTGLAATVVP
jgi:thiamine biosynthesis protein ThiI